ncbi:hypothetical protein KJI95_18300 [Shewanella sp. JM162201]|uniref:Uncharacterized protein n=1 Tax=Shewanella jiangmenensis TaxID=2837387 RepID=A0ABS5V9N6_9GAMM|nr:hypothetical protein [Shewanella jiangmenensis]MBT1446449.1 hypothetical protein [Shewanella jiangmenensis]
MKSQRTLISHQWLVCSAVLMLGTMLALPARYWPLVLLPLVCIGKQCWHARSPGKRTLSAIFVLWLGCFSAAMWM